VKRRLPIYPKSSWRRRLATAAHTGMSPASLVLDADLDLIWALVDENPVPRGVLE
jgi:hypothetical protein